MYELGTVLVLGLIVAKLVDLVRHTTGVTPSTRLALAVVAGLGLAWALDYSMFAGWGITFRELWMGTVATGLAIGGLAALWHEVLDAFSSYARRSHDEATEIESRIPRAA
ncbi:MAG: hypothetical protein WD757_08455 [Actinomycetota bacterium]